MDGHTDRAGCCLRLPRRTGASKLRGVPGDPLDGNRSRLNQRASDREHAKGGLVLQCRNVPPTPLFSSLLPRIRQLRANLDLSPTGSKGAGKMHAG